MEAVRNAPLGIERIDAHKLVLLRCVLCVLLQQVRNVLVVIILASHGRVVPMHGKLVPSVGS